LLSADEISSPQPAARSVSRLAALAFAFAPLLLPTNAQITPLITVNGLHTVTAGEGKEVTLNETITGNANAILSIEGSGRVNLKKKSDAYLGRVIIRGADFQNDHTGLMFKARSFTISNGGSLTLDNSGASEVDHLGNNTEVILSGGTFRIIGRTGYNNYIGGEDFGSISIASGANTIDIHNQRSDTLTNIHLLKTLSHSGTATLNLIGNRAYSGTLQNDSIIFRYSTRSGSFAINEIIPWATMSGASWATPIANNGEYYLVSFTNYHTGAQATWGETHNISLTRNETLTAHRRINSLRIASPAFTLNLGKNHTLHIKSGGILAAGDNARVTGRGKLSALDKRPLYIHTYGDKLALEDQAALGDATNPNGDVDLVKTGNGALVLNSEATHRLGTITINQGIIKVLKGWLAVVGKIILGDGAGTDVLELGANSKNRIQKTGGGLPSITLYGNPFGPTSDEAILRFSGGTQQQLATLHIQDRGTIDFSSGSKSAPNILCLDHLTFNNSDARLTIRNWNYESDYLLVKYKNGNTTIPSILKQIRFEGYDVPALWHWHFLKGFDDYWQITAVPAPEPTTTGTLLSLMALALFILKRKPRNIKL